MELCNGVNEKDSFLLNFFLSFSFFFFQSGCTRLIINYYITNKSGVTHSYRHDGPKLADTEVKRFFFIVPRRIEALLTLSSSPFSCEGVQFLFRQDFRISNFSKSNNGGIVDGENPKR